MNYSKSPKICAREFIMDILSVWNRRLFSIRIFKTNNRTQMDYLVKNEKLVIQHTPGNGAWTYQVIIPITKDIKGKWGILKVS